jgi:dephospho-CoA kinase
MSPTPETPTQGGGRTSSGGPGGEPPSGRLLVGLTGGLAAGKSTVARLLAEQGITVFDADRLVAELYRPGAAGTARVRELFGDALIGADGAVDRAAMAGLVFRDPAALRRLEAAIHPLVRDRFVELATGRGGIVAVEATRLVEAGWGDELDLVVTVEAPVELRLERAVARGMDRDEARRRLLAQGEGEARRRRSDLVVVNDGDLDGLRRRVGELVRDLRRRLGDKEVRG